MSKKSGISWLAAELPELVKKGIINENASSKLREYYGMAGIKPRMTLFELFSVIGGGLVAIGIILVFAYNWASFPKFVRLVLALLPLIAAQALAVYTVNLKKSSVSMREGVAVFWAISVGASIALISQVYHIMGKLSDYSLVWMLMIIPVMYILESASAYVVYLALTVMWTSSAQIDGGNSLLYWPLLAPALPFLAQKLKEDRYSNKAMAMSFLLAVSLTAGLGVSLEKCIPGLWMIIYTSFFVCLYLMGGMMHDKDDSLVHKPLYVFGVIGLSFIIYMLTFDWPWEHIGWSNYRYMGKYQPQAAFVDYIFTLALPLGAMFLLNRADKKGVNSLLSFGIAPGVVALCFVAVSANEIRYLPYVIFAMNAYFFYLGVSTMIRGIKENRMSIMNGGMLMFVVLVVTWFLKMEMSFLSRGIMFIIIGAAFLGANRYMSLKIKAVSK